MPSCTWRQISCTWWSFPLKPFFSSCDKNNTNLHNWIRIHIPWQRSLTWLVTNQNAPSRAHGLLLLRKCHGVWHTITWTAGGVFQIWWQPISVRGVWSALIVTAWWQRHKVEQFSLKNRPGAILGLATRGLNVKTEKMQ
jgi:hypothetical protein